MALYDNCRIQYNGQLLSFCNLKRARWYLDRNLATKVSDDPLTIELLFEPEGKIASHEFFLEARENKCVVCGVKDDLTLHHVVPYAYRRLFPEHLKKHNSHDVVALCIPCHRRYETIANVKKMELIDRYGLNREEIKNNHIRLKRAQGIAYRLIEGNEYANVNFLLDFLGKPAIDKADLEAIIKQQPEKMDFYSLSNLIVPLLTDIQAFVVEWREHFVKSMEPKYLPKTWSVENQINACQ